MKVCEVRGKSTRQLRKVYVLFTSDMVQGLNYLLSTRSSVGVLDENQYLFPRQTSLGPIDGCGAMRDITNACPKLKNPKAIRTRGLRKYLATTLQIQ